MNSRRYNNQESKNMLTSLATMKCCTIPYYLKGMGWYTKMWSNPTQAIFLGKNRTEAAKSLEDME